MRNLLTEYSPLQDSKHQLSPSRKRKTLGNINDFEDHSWTYSSFKHSLDVSGHKKFMINPDYSKLVEENESLRRQVQRLKNLVPQEEKSSRELERMGSAVWSRRGEKSPEDMGKMKKILEKSYYSIKEMEKQITELTYEVNSAKKECQRLTKRLQLCEIERDDLFQKLESLKAVHKQEMWVCNERIRKLEAHVEQLILISDHDQKEWRDHMNKLLELKGFSVKRTNYK